jgi:methyl-accepting chemotaxis protein
MQTESQGKGRKSHPGRKTWLINPRFQMVFMAYMVGVSAMAIGIFYGANLYFFHDFTKTGQSLGLPPEHVFFQFLANQRQTMNYIFAGTSVILLAALGMIGLLFSHRVAGPLYRLHKHMTDVAEGKTMDDVKFRQKDFFMEIADAYNRQMARYRDNVSQGGESSSDRKAA